MEFTDANFVQIHDNTIDVNTGGSAVEIGGEYTVFRNNTVNIDESYSANSGIVLRGNQLSVENNTIGNSSIRNISFTALNIRSDTAFITGNTINKI